MDSIITQALQDTYRKYGLNQIVQAAIVYMRSGAANRFTRSNGVRIIEQIKPEDVMRAFASEYIKKVTADNIGNFNISDKLENAILMTERKYNINEINESSQIVTLLVDFLNGKNHFTRDGNSRELAGQIGVDNALQQIVCTVITQLAREWEKEKQGVGVKNIQICSENINKVQSKLLSGMQFSRCEGDISLGKEMNASMRLGNERTNQEDAILLMQHPQNEKFKLMVVADGMGGQSLGEVASHTVTSRIEQWFNSLDASYYTNIKQLETILDNELKKISAEISQKYMQAGSTFVGAIVGEEKTLVSNIGDSRAYITKGAKLEQISEDHGITYEMWKSGMIEKKDDIRFHRKSNVIRQYMGMDGQQLKPSFHILDNREYDAVMLFSDGVTDCLSDEQLYAITLDTDKSKLAQKIAETALRNDSMVRAGLRENPAYKQMIRGGKDNTTAAVYSRRDGGTEYEK